jgi:Uma2 family endonuclease
MQQMARLNRRTAEICRTTPRSKSLVTWEEFLRLPERPEGGQHYELQDGEVIVVPPARPLHIKLRKRIERLLESIAGDRGVVND